MGALFRIFFFFVFFISFSVINVPAIQWGLQMSWALALVLFFLYPLFRRDAVVLTVNRNIRIVSIYFFSIILLTVISWISQKLGYVVFEDAGALFSRSLSHTVYLIFEYCVFILVSIYLQNSKFHDKDVRAFITYPFYFIIIWGFYQWLSTFDIVPYLEIFNNNASTGFTYLRFKDHHRCSSVFPEPSEFAYYLAFIMPFVVYQYFKYREHPVFSKHHILMAILFFAGVVMCGSMAFFAVFPILLIYTVRRYIKLTPTKLVAILFGGVVILGGVLYLSAGRLADVGSGEDGSTISRFLGLMEAVDLFIASPIVGAGFGAIRGMDLLSFILGTTGILGLISFVWLVFSLRVQAQTNKLFFQGLRCVVIVTMISNPVIDFMFFWIVLAFISNELTPENGNSLHHSSV